MVYRSVAAGQRSVVTLSVSCNEMDELCRMHFKNKCVQLGYVGVFGSSLDDAVQPLGLDSVG
jgi:hypothetical protein